MMTGHDCYRFESRMGIMAKILPLASVNRKLSGSRPEWRLATSGARVFAAAIASQDTDFIFDRNGYSQPIDREQGGLLGEGLRVCLA